jgi:hypothetical protein
VLGVSSSVGPGSVVSSGEAFLVGLHFASNSGNANFFALIELELVRVEGSIAVLVADAIDIIDVDIGGQVEEPHHCSGASGCHIVCKVGVLIFALILLDGVVEISVVEAVPVGHFNVGGSGIHIPVGDSIAHHKSLQVEGESTSLVLLYLVISVDLVNHIWHIYASVRFSRNIEFVGLELREFILEKVEQGS